MTSTHSDVCAGVGVLINIGVDKLAQVMIGCKLRRFLLDSGECSPATAAMITRDCAGKTGLAKEDTNATQLWDWMAGNISLVKGHPAVAAYYGCVRPHSLRLFTPIGWCKRD